MPVWHGRSGQRSSSIRLRGSKKIISKQEALEKAKEEIKRYGLELNQNPDIEILKAPNYDEISYVIKSGRLEVNINALTGKLTGFYQNSDNKEKQLEKYHSTKEKIVEVAKEKMKEYGFGSEYEICYISNNNSDDEEKAYLWYIWFAKKYTPPRRVVCICAFMLLVG